MSDDKTEVVQTWFHVEDVKSPRKLRIIRDVRKIKTNKNYFDIDTFKKIKNNPEKCTYNDVSIKNRLNDSELSFLFLEDNTLRVLLGSLDEWPLIPKTSESNDLRYVKVELRYTHVVNATSTLFKRFFTPFKNDGILHEKLKKNIFILFLRISECFWPKYETGLKIARNVQPEFHITIPKGMRILNDSFTLEYELRIPEKRKNFNHLCHIEDIVIKKKDNSRRKANIIFNREDYNDLQQYIRVLEEKNQEYQLILHVNYKTRPQFKLTVLPWFTILLSYLLLTSTYYSIEILNNAVIDLVTKVTLISFPSLFIIAAILPFLIYLLTKHNEGYEIYLYNFFIHLNYALLILLLLKIFYELHFLTNIVITI
ncbi:MAG: hypothetical protein FWH29_08425 [Methanobrevibacter sp.]|nr:hypothetical protein [Methanobrevibacter sp.]